MSFQDAVNAYLDCLLWSEPVDDTGESLDSANYERSDFAEESVTQAKNDLTDFISAAGDLLNDLDDTQIGHDFALTRNRHGAGFWDRGLGDVGAALTEMCRPFGPVNAYAGDDGKVYLG